MQEGGDMCIHAADSCCRAERDRTLETNYTLIKNK